MLKLTKIKGVEEDRPLIPPHQVNDDVWHYAYKVNSDTDCVFLQEITFLIHDSFFARFSNSQIPMR